MSIYFEPSDDFETCWKTGEWDGQICAMCPYNGDCSGSENEDDD